MKLLSLHGAGMSIEECHTARCAGTWFAVNGAHGVPKALGVAMLFGVWRLAAGLARGLAGVCVARACGEQGPGLGIFQQRGINGPGPLCSCALIPPLNSSCIIPDPASCGYFQA